MPTYVLRESRASEIADLAHSVADYYFPNKWIDPESVIRQLELSLSFNYYGDTFDGMLEWKRSGFHVYCNLTRVDSSTSNRARFTLAHELGHYFIDSHRNALQSGKVPAHPSFCLDNNPDLAVEQEANYFASHLLMPEERFLKVIDWEASQLSIGTIIELQNTFNVSFQSAAIRAVESSINCMAAGVMWKAGGTPWYVLSPAFLKANYRSVKRNMDLLPTDCATKIAISKTANGNTGINEIEKTITTASWWFFGVNSGTLWDIVLIEEAVRLGKRGVFTLLIQKR